LARILGQWVMLYASKLNHQEKPGSHADPLD
jgi:hypothetical protein